MHIVSKSLKFKNFDKTEFQINGQIITFFEIKYDEKSHYTNSAVSLYIIITFNKLCMYWSKARTDTSVMNANRIPCCHTQYNATLYLQPDPTRQ
jgi:hypothetical protein